MQVRLRTLRLTKLVPLSISRGTSTGSYNLYVFFDREGLTGVGECAPGTGQDETLAGEATEQIERFFVDTTDRMSISRIYDLARSVDMSPPAIAAIDTALWDWIGKKAGMPLYRLLGLDRPVASTSVTVGINTPERTAQLTKEWLHRVDAKAIKLKLGSPDGIEADKAAFEACRSAIDEGSVPIRVDANGGWSVADAKAMMRWLADRGCEYVEQPLAKGEEDGLPEIFEGRPLPIFVDESVHFSQDVPGVADRCDGVNLKLMKCGGITEALRIVATARAHGLKTMIGCMGESSISIAAGAAISCLFDYVDLDAHLNLNPDPATGLKWVSGVVLPTEQPGHGAKLL